MVREQHDGLHVIDAIMIFRDGDRQYCLQSCRRGFHLSLYLEKTSTKFENNNLLLKYALSQ